MAFRGEQFSCCVDLGSIRLLVCCWFWSFSDWVFTMLMSMPIRSYFGYNVLSAFHRSCMWLGPSSLLCCEEDLVAVTLLSFSSVSIELSCYLPIIMFDTSSSPYFLPSCSLQNFAYSNHRRQSTSAVVSSCWNTLDCILLSTSYVQYGQCTPKPKCDQSMHCAGLAHVGTAGHDSLHIACRDVSHPSLSN